MKKILITTLICISTMILFSQELRDNSGVLIGQVERNEIRDSGGILVGRIQSDGNIVDEQYLPLGKMEIDGIIRNNIGVMVGEVESDGTVWGTCGRKIGK